MYALYLHSCPFFPLYTGSIVCLFMIGTVRAVVRIGPEVNGVKQSDLVHSCLQLISENLPEIRPYKNMHLKRMCFVEFRQICEIKCTCSRTGVCGVTGVLYEWF